MSVRAVVTFALALAFATSPARASSIGVFFAADASDCDFTQDAAGPITWYIVAVLDGDHASSGIVAAEFSQRGTPTGWFMNWAPSSLANVNLISGAGIVNGTTIAFPTCQTGAIVLLYTVSSFATSVAPPNTYLTVEAHPFPSNPNFDCPLVAVCNPPVSGQPCPSSLFTLRCVGGTSAIINGLTCNIAVDRQTWSTVKNLYD
jgi:hypothetical protein